MQQVCEEFRPKEASCSQTAGGVQVVGGDELRYRVMSSILGKGQVGVVVSISDPVTGPDRELAAKFVHISTGKDRATFESEVAIQRKLQCCSPTVYHSLVYEGVHGNVGMIVMNPISGVLASAPVDHWAQFADQLSYRLFTMHSNDVSHNDLHLENIGIIETLGVVIIDYGLSLAKMSNTLDMLMRHVNENALETDPPKGRNYSNGEIDLQNWQLVSMFRNCFPLVDIAMILGSIIETAEASPEAKTREFINSFIHCVISRYQETFPTVSEVLQVWLQMLHDTPERQLHNWKYSDPPPDIPSIMQAEGFGYDLQSVSDVIMYHTAVFKNYN